MSISIEKIKTIVISTEPIRCKLVIYNTIMKSI